MMKSLLSALCLSGVCALSAAEQLPAPDRPFMIIRFSTGEESPEKWAPLLAQLKKYPGSCDEVWFSNGTSIVSLDVHRARAAKMARAAEDLRKIGIIPSLQIQSTIGHSDSSINDPAIATWGKYVGRNGEICTQQSCPRQKAFHQYYREVAKIYAAWHPGSVWIDDDLRLTNHAPASAPGGCYCPDCLKEFSAKEKYNYTREELVTACEKDPALNNRWLQFGEESIAMVATAIAKGFREVSPETRLALQHCYHPERVAVLNALYKASGKRVGSRPGAGTYSDHDPYLILLKGIKVSQEIFSQPGYEILDQIAPEIEDYPRVYASKTDRGHQLEAMFYLAMGGDSLSYYSYASRLETPESFGTQILAPLSREADCYKAYVQHTLGTLPGGIGILKTYPGIQEIGLPLIGIPFGSHSTAACCRLLTKSIIDAMTDEELKSALANDLILDGEATLEIGKRGFAEQIGGITSLPGVKQRTETYEDTPFSQGLDRPRYQLDSTYRYHFVCPASPKIQILSHYGENSHQGQVATALLTRPDGTRVAFIGYDGFQMIFASRSRIEFLTRIADWVSHNRLPVLAAEPIQCVLTPRITKEGELKAITVINAVIGHQAPFVLKLRGVTPSRTKAVWSVPGRGSQVLPLVKQGEFTLVTIPEMEGWDSGWLKL